MRGCRGTGAAPRRRCCCAPAGAPAQSMHQHREHRGPLCIWLRLSAWPRPSQSAQAISEGGGYCPASQQAVLVDCECRRHCCAAGALRRAWGSIRAQSSHEGDVKKGIQWHDRPMLWRRRNERSMAALCRGRCGIQCSMPAAVFKCRGDLNLPAQPADIS
jgi:hypothetical protein